MKQLIAILSLFMLMLSCKGQGKPSYTQKLEFGLKENVKEVTTYFCQVENDVIPTKTENQIGKATMTFDKKGNVLERKRKWDFGNDKTSEFSNIYSGKGKNISFKETARFGNDEPREINFKYVWSDDYNYTVVCLDDKEYVSSITLDKNFLLIKNQFQKGNEIQYIEEIETNYENDKIKEIKTKNTSNYNKKEEVSHQLQVVQKYDNKGNPTVIYAYKNEGKKELEQVI